METSKSRPSSARVIGLGRVPQGDTRCASRYTDRTNGHDRARPRFAICIRNEGYKASFEPHKIYRIDSDLDADKEGEVRVIDESGEDYLYPSDWVVSIEAPEVVE
jgi:hypothetical protein